MPCWLWPRCATDSWAPRDWAEPKGVAQLTCVPPTPCALQVGQSLPVPWDGPGHLWKYVGLGLPHTAASQGSLLPSTQILIAWCGQTWAITLNLKVPSLLHLLLLTAVLGEEHCSWR